MEKHRFDYSLKNIPVPGNTAYMKRLLHQVDAFIKRMRWKIFWFENSDAKVEKETYGFNSQKTPPQHKALIAFEEDVYALCSSLTFSDRRSNFQRKMKKDLREVMNSFKPPTNA